MGLFVNLEKEDAREAVCAFQKWLTGKGVSVALLSEHAEALGREGGISEEAFFEKPDLIVSFGGDGTFLHVARRLAADRPALLGVNFGRLGYLTAVEATGLQDFFSGLLEGELPVEHRLRLGCRADGWTDAPLALNDVVIQDTEGVRTVRLRIRYGSRVIGEFRCDGAIVATPTGSTAYTLSVGGPVVHPGVEALLIALVSPHTLSARPIVVGTDRPITIELLEERPVRVTLDGQVTRELEPETEIRITRAARDVSVVVDPDRSYLDRLRHKLGWGGAGA